MFPVIGISVFSPKVVRVTGVVLNINCRADGRNTPISDTAIRIPVPGDRDIGVQSKGNPCNRCGVEYKLTGRRSEYTNVCTAIRVPVPGNRDIGVQSKGSPSNRCGVEYKLPGRRSEYTNVCTAIRVPVPGNRDISAQSQM